MKALSWHMLGAHMADPREDEYDELCRETIHQYREYCDGYKPDKSWRCLELV